jgi:hypothetical protein
MGLSLHRAIAPLALAIASAAPAVAVTLGSIDDFQDGTTQGWGSGPLNPNPPINVPDVGPTGPGDDSLQITATGGAFSGSRFTAFNETQWAGDYPTAGVELIVLDVNNIGSVTLNVRIALDGAGGRFVTTGSVPVPAGSGWNLIWLWIGPGDLSAAGGLDVNATLGAVTQLRVISAANPTFMGDVILAQGLVDNVIAAPEPAESVLLASGLALLVLLSRGRQVQSPASSACRTHGRRGHSSSFRDWPPSPGDIHARSLRDMLDAAKRLAPGASMGA